MLNVTDCELASDHQTNYLWAPEGVIFQGVDGKLPDGSRLQATLARTVTKGSTYTIRRFSSNPLTPIDLIKYKSLCRLLLNI